MKIYLAGKIKKHCWRHSIVDAFYISEMSFACYGDGGLEYLSRFSTGWPVIKDAIRGVHDYTGPFFFSCDHGCFHGEGRHGVGAETYHHDKTEEARGIVMRNSLMAIFQSDLVFAWIDCETCYGTLVELGFARAHGKVICVASEKPISDDLWFAARVADKVFQGQLDDCFTQALRFADDCRLNTMPYKEYLQTPHWIKRRERSLEAAGRRCQVCNDGAITLNVHHRTYERRGCERDDDLIVLCQPCHELFHKNGKLAH